MQATLLVRVTAAGVGWLALADMRKDRRCLRTRIDDNKLSTFSHFIWITVYTVGANNYWDLWTNYRFIDPEMDTSLHFC